ncbi:hypothetical protein Pmar_PMAR009417 [Perkinsus marinus ATCC 50983]|uniref:Serine carboxypeptidase n=1 Tax=Perkinsus marinus (strain ATCC 50983 / TXsc) TaxID=423536 RepID=C5KL14_PERM5|nr:hypothetical protein Pmar_PMAR009417 [Perkinsus marinus ATCC 50983]EER14822.1 hypothetical protein Pmar_PMAR009417 [Perkinsus marinus ATCC 50983]|eukprot:XP_002783026.1 hypothetical protein Pmar_PMAR009417 [Perkinsus marinus ATCC 50983]
MRLLELFFYMPEIKTTYGRFSVPVGLLRSITWKRRGMLGFLQVYQAGHSVPLDQPEAAHLMIYDFIDGVPGPFPGSECGEAEL